MGREEQDWTVFQKPGPFTAEEWEKVRDADPEMMTFHAKTVATLNALFTFRESLRGCILQYPGSEHPAGQGTKYIDFIAEQLGLK